MPASKSVRLIRRATCLSLRRDSSARLPSREVPTKDRTEVDASEVQPLFERMHRAGLVRGTAANLDFAPAGLGVQRQQGALVEDLDPTAGGRRVVLVNVEADNFRAPEAPGIADQQDRTIPQPAQVEGQGGNHREDVFG